MKRTMVIGLLLAGMINTVSAENLPVVNSKLAANEGTLNAATAQTAPSNTAVPSTPASPAAAPGTPAAVTAAKNPLKKDEVVVDRTNILTLGGMERFNYNNVDKTGLYWDVLKAIFASEGITVEIKNMPYLIAISEAEKGVLDGALAYPAHPRESSLPARNVIFPNFPIDNVQLVAVYYKTSFPEFKGTSSLNGKIIALYRGYDFENLLGVKFTRNAYNDLETGLKRLEGTYADALIDIKEDIKIAAEGSFIDLGKFQVADLLKYKAYVVFANNERGKRFSAIFDKKMKALLADHSMERVYTTWNNVETYKMLLEMSEKPLDNGCKVESGKPCAPDAAASPAAPVVPAKK